jgi:hypothetical protein
MTKQKIRIIQLIGIRDGFLEFINIIGSGDASHLPHDEVCHLFKQYSGGTPRLVEALEMLLPSSQNLFQEQGSQRLKLVTCLKILKLIFSSI